MFFIPIIHTQILWGRYCREWKKDKDGNEKLKYVFTPGPFTRMLKKAQEDPSNHYYLVIEELNRGNAPAIFGERYFSYWIEKMRMNFLQKKLGRVNMEFQIMMLQKRYMGMKITR